MNSPPDSAPLENAVAAATAEPHAQAPRRRRKRWLWPLLLFAGLIAVLWTPVIRPHARDAMTHWHALAAEHYLLQNDLDAARDSAEQVVAWAVKRLPNGDFNVALEKPESALAEAPLLGVALRLRGEVSLARGELERSLADYNTLVKFNPHLARAYRGRAAVLQRLGRHREAIDDTTRVVELRTEGDSDALNARAYTRAIAQLELEEALRDAERALAGLPQRPLDLGDTINAINVLDTRGYVRYLLGDYRPALADMDEALRSFEAVWEQVQQPSVAPRMKQEMQHSLAVMHQHRGLIHEKLGNAAEARVNLRRAQELGYDPAKGVY